MIETVEEIAKRIRASNMWNTDDAAKLCKEAGLIDEFNEADGDEFEKVIEKAADILNVNIY